MRARAAGGTTLSTGTGARLGRHGLAWVLSSSALSNLGDGIGKVAFPLLAATLTRDPLLIAALSMAQFLPWLLFGALAGLLLDRTDRRRAMFVANLARAVVVGALALTVLLGLATLPMVYVAALLAGIAETIADSAANVLIPAVVDHDDLESANSKLQSIEVIGQTFLGSPVGGVAFALFAALPFLLTSASFAAAAMLLLVLGGGFVPRPVPGSRTAPKPVLSSGTADPRGKLVDGLRWLHGQPLLVRLGAVAALLGFTMEFSQAQLVLYALEDLSLPEASFGWFALAAGAGGLVGAAVSPRLARHTARSAILTVGIAVTGAATSAMGYVRQPVVAGLLLAAVGGGVVAVNVIIATLRHVLIPDELLGRVLGIWRTVVWGSIAIGALAGGVLTKLLGGVSRNFAVSGVLIVLIALGSLVVLRPFRAQIDARETVVDGKGAG